MKRFRQGAFGEYGRWEKFKGNPNETECVWGKPLGIWKHHMEICLVTKSENIYFKGYSVPGLWCFLINFCLGDS